MPKLGQGWGTWGLILFQGLRTVDCQHDITAARRHVNGKPNGCSAIQLQNSIDIHWAWPGFYTDILRQPLTTGQHAFLGADKGEAVCIRPPQSSPPTHGSGFLKGCIRYGEIPFVPVKRSRRFEQISYSLSLFKTSQTSEGSEVPTEQLQGVDTTEEPA